MILLGTEFDLRLAREGADLDQLCQVFTQYHCQEPRAQMFLRVNNSSPPLQEGKIAVILTPHFEHLFSSVSQFHCVYQVVWCLSMSLLFSCLSLLLG